MTPYRDLSSLRFEDADVVVLDSAIIVELIEALHRITTLVSIIETRYYQEIGRRGPL